MRVAVIQTLVGSSPEITHRGEWDGKRVDGEFARVSGMKHPTHIGYLFLEEHAEMVVLELQNRWRVKKEAEKAFDSTWYEMRNLFGAR